MTEYHIPDVMSAAELLEEIERYTEVLRAAYADVEQLDLLIDHIRTGVWHSAPTVKEQTAPDITKHNRYIAAAAGAGYNIRCGCHMCTALRAAGVLKE